MTETDSQGVFETGMTPSIEEKRLQKMATVRSGDFDESEAGGRTDTFVVRIPKSQMTVSLRLNTRLLAEQREIEALNEAIRRAGW